MLPIVGEYLHGITASSLNEARLGYEQMGKEVHAYAPAFMDNEIHEMLKYVDHMVFNSFEQWHKHKDKVKNVTGKHIECGLRVNPEYSEIEVALYNPCAPYSRMGIVASEFKPEYLEGIDGLHFHTLCEQNSDALARTLPHIEEKFGPYLHQMKWLNFGGGHHITRSDYDVESLIKSINYMKDKYDLQIYLEPGEAIALNTGYLVATVLDIVHNGMPVAILDASAACHMPDVIEMPYRPNIIDASYPNEKAYTYRLGGNTCLSGDIIGDYSFDEPLKVGDRIVFCDMAHYTMVKNNTFNGVNLPSIASYSDEKGIVVHRTFGYQDYFSRL
jgi:carboxynorspermidine decarboxylase